MKKLISVLIISLIAFNCFAYTCINGGGVLSFMGNNNVKKSLMGGTLSIETCSRINTTSFVFGLEAGVGLFFSDFQPVYVLTKGIPVFIFPEIGVNILTSSDCESTLFLIPIKYCEDNIFCSYADTNEFNLFPYSGQHRILSSGIKYDYLNKTSKFGAYINIDIPWRLILVNQSFLALCSSEEVVHTIAGVSLAFGLRIPIFN